MNRTPPPDWDALPDLIPSVDVARLFAVKSSSLGKMVKRQQLAPPIRTETNMAWYAKADVRAGWVRRERRAATLYAPVGPDVRPDSPDIGGDGGGDTGIGGDNPSALNAAPPASEALTLTRADLRDLLAEAVADGTRRGNEELRAEVAALREEVTRLRRAAEQPPTEPPTFWRRLSKWAKGGAE